MPAKAKSRVKAKAKAKAKVKEPKISAKKPEIKLSERLIEIARHSPKEYAKDILVRNTFLLKVLKAARCRIGERFSDITIMGGSIYGCPHCKETTYCSDCLWYKFSNNGCGNAPFDGITLSSLNDAPSTVRVRYYSNSENITFYGRTTKEDYDRAVRFLEAHIAWAKLPCWGEEYKE